MTKNKDTNTGRARDRMVEFHRVLHILKYHFPSITCSGSDLIPSMEHHCEYLHKIFQEVDDNCDMPVTCKRQCIQGDDVHIESAKDAASTILEHIDSMGNIMVDLRLPGLGDPWGPMRASMTSVRDEMGGIYIEWETDHCVDDWDDDLDDEA